MAGIGQVSLNNKPYNIAPIEGSYKVTEVPNHGDVDPKMERRVIWRNTSLGIQRRREDPSLDSTSIKSSAFTYMRQVRNPEGIYWAAGGDTTRQDRIFAQRFVSTSNFGVISPPSDAPFLFLDGSIKSIAVTPNKVYTLTPPGTWALSATFSSNNEVSDAIQYGGQIYVAIQPTYGIATGVTSTTLTDSSAAWVPGQFVGATLTMGTTSSIVTGNTATTLTFVAGWSGAITNSGGSVSYSATTVVDTAAVFTATLIGYTVQSGSSTMVVTGVPNPQTLVGSWSGGTPANQALYVVLPALTRYQLTKGLWTWNQLTSNTWVQQPNTVAASYLTVIREQLWRSVGANIYSTVNTDPGNQIWSGATVIGDPNSYITGLDVFKDFLIIFKQDGIYSADKSGSVYPLFPGFKSLGQNPRPLGQFQDQYLFAADYGLVWSYTPRGGVRRIGFDFAEPYPMNPSDPTTKFSVPNAVRRGVPLTHYMIVGFNQYLPNSTSSSWFLAWDGNGWHPLHYEPNNTSNAVGLTGGNISPVNPILHFAHTNTSGVLEVHYLQNPMLDPYIAASFDPSPQYIYYPVDNGALEDEFKVLERVNVIIDNPEAGTIKMAYALDNDIGNLIFQDMGEPQFQGTKGNQIFYPSFPLPTYNRILLRLTLTPNAPATQNTPATKSPAVRTVVLHYKQRSPQRRGWEIVLLAEENLIGPGGRLDTRKVAPIINDLNEIRANHQQVEFIDALRRTINVYVDEVGEDIKVLKGDTNPSYLVNIKLFENVSGK